MMKWDPESMKPGVFYMTEEAYRWFKKEYARLYDYFVYILTAPNGRIYIGYGKGNPEKRWANGNGYNHNTALKAAIKEYGWENFKREVYKDELCLEEARDLECRLIKEKGSTDPEIGYNKRLPKAGDEARAHHSVYQLVFPNGKMYVGRTSGKLEDRWNNGNGYYHDKELYAAIKEFGWESVVKIRCIEDFPEECAIALEEYLIEANHTTDPSRGYNKSKGGKVESGWKKSEESVERGASKVRGRKPSESELQKMRKAAGSRSHPVLNVDSGEIYPSQEAAAKALNVAKTTVSACLRGKQSRVKGYILRRLDE